LYYPCGNVIPRELDTGSSVSVISEADYVKYFKGEKLKKSLLVLKTYSADIYVEVSSFVLQNDTLHGYVLYGGTGYMYSP
jgi:hypothetical protein